MCVLGIAIRLYEKTEGTMPDSLTELESIGLKLNGLNQHDGTAFQYRLLDTSLIQSRAKLIRKQYHILLSMMGRTKPNCNPSSREDVDKMVPSLGSGNRFEAFGSLDM